MEKQIDELMIEARKMVEESQKTLSHIQEITTKRDSDINKLGDNLKLLWEAAYKQGIKDAKHRITIKLENSNLFPDDFDIETLIEEIEVW